METAGPNEHGERIKHIFLKIEEAIADLPQDCLEVVSTKPDYDVAKLQIEAETALDHLSLHAQLGSAEAVRALRNLGNQSSNILRLLATSECSEFIPLIHLATTGDEPPDHVPGSYPSWEYRDSKYPSVQLCCSLRAISDILTCESEILRAIPKKMLLASLPPQFRTSYPLNIDPRGLGVDPKFQKIITAMIESRFAAVLGAKVAETVKLTATESLAWPVTTWALSERKAITLAQIESLELGTSMPFRLGPTGKRGTGRDTSPESTLVFALERCVSLLHQQREFTGFSAKERRTMRGLERRFDAARSKAKGNVMILSQEIGGHKVEWDSRSLWRLKAALLPEFPRKASAPELAFKRWHKAAVLYAEFECGGNWQTYKWPECVEKERIKNKGTYEAAVSQVLTDGIKLLRFP